MSEQLFRKSAVEKLSSPEQLDVMMQVTSPMGWIALIGVAVMLVFATVWAVVGEIGTKVDGEGILIRGASVLDVTSGTQGRLLEVMAKPGDIIKEGQVVARLDQPELELKAGTTRAELELKIANVRAQIADAQVEAQRAVGAGSSIVAKYRQQLVELREKAATQEQLVKKGLLTSSTLFRTKEQITSTEQLIAQNEGQMSGQGGRVRDLQRELAEYEARLASAKKEATAKIAGTTEVKSPHGGRVLEVVASQGSLINPGGRLMTLEPMDAPLESHIYIPAGDGKKVRPGMEVRVSPSTVKSEEFGFMLAKVKSVSDFPVTPEGLRGILRNDKLVETMMKGGPPIEVVAELIPDSSTPSGFKWSSSKGPPTQIYSGTMSKGSVVVETKAPITLIIPMVKKTLGG